MLDKTISRRSFFCCLALFTSMLPFTVKKNILAKSYLPKETMLPGSMKTNPRIGIALGAGGAKGIAHISLLEALEELGLTPHMIAGSSIGAIIGSLYAAGLSAAMLKNELKKHIITKGDSWRDILFSKKLIELSNIIDPVFGNNGFINGEMILDLLFEDITYSRFEELKIPLKIVTTDFWKREQVVYNSGSFLPVIHGSIAVPGLFSPVKYDSRILVDGGLVNPVPYDLLTKCCDIVIAVDINKNGSERKSSIPSYFDSIFHSIMILQQSIMEQKIKSNPPDIYITPKLNNIRTLEFYKADEIFRQTEPVKEQLKRELEKLLV